MTRLYDSDVALVRVLVVLGFLMWLPTDVYLRQAADDLCLQLVLPQLDLASSATCAVFGK
jgi:hypothetical protein